MKKSREPLPSMNGRSHEVAALLAAARAMLENRDFADAARAVLAACKTIIGADAGLVAVRAADGKGLEVVLLDPAGFELDAAAADGLPAPLRRLSARAARGGRAVFDNDLSKGTARKAARGQRSAPKSALFAPIMIGGDAEGLVGLLDKPDGFSAADSQLAEVFAEMAAVAMLNSRTLNGLEKNRNALEGEVRQSVTELRRAEENFRALVENLPDVIARVDAELRHLYVSPAIQRLTGRPSLDYLGKTNREVGIPSEVAEPWDAALRRA